jgi:hypothetical protein
MWRRGDQKWDLLLYQFLKVFLNSNLRIVENFELFDVEAYFWRVPEVGPVTRTVFLNSYLRIVENFELLNVQARGLELGPFTVLKIFLQLFKNNSNL